MSLAPFLLAAALATQDAGAAAPPAGEAEVRALELRRQEAIRSGDTATLDVDPYVPTASADAFVAAARDPKTTIWYEAGHELNAKARADRLAWLEEKLRLR
jgi:hypothetical protein